MASINSTRVSQEVKSHEPRVQSHHLEEGVAHQENGDLPEKLEHANAAREEDSTDRMTAKTWTVITILSLIYGLAWWPIPVTIYLQGFIAAQMGDPQAVYWFVSVFAAAIAVGYLLSGANSDLFGRRLTLIVGEAGLGVGLIVCATSKTPAQFQAGMGLSGFFAGVCFMILCSIPELMPLKHRHLGLAIADAMGFITVVIGPVVSSYAIRRGGGTWRWLYWADVIMVFATLAAILWMYHPPKHPKGVPWHEALRGSDWVGVVLATLGLVLTLTGIIYTSYLPSNDLRVIILLCLGFPLLVVFGLWETYSKVKYKLCPPAIFTANKGRDFTAPLVVESIVSMYYFGVQVIFTTMINELWVTPSTSQGTQLSLTLASSLGLCTGVVILGVFGTFFSKKIGFRWALVVAVGLMLVMGGIMTLVTPFNRSLMIAFTFLQQVFYAYSVIASITLVLWGVHQHDLGIATGIAGTGRNVGGALAQAVYTTILVNVQGRRAAEALPKAAMDAGLPAAAAQELLKVWALGPAAREAIPGVDDQVLAAAGLAWRWAVCNGLRIVGLASLGFGITGWLVLFWCSDPEPKMTDRIEVFLENDVQAEKNEFH